MWLLVELLIVPVMIVLWIIISSVVAHFGVGAFLLGVTIATLVFLILRATLRLLWRLETDAGIHDEEHSK